MLKTISSAADAQPIALADAGRAYDAVDRRYLTYADGDMAAPFAFTGQYSFADRQIWARLDETLTAMVAQGRRSLRILDVGCGPGTWLQRVVLRAADIGFTRIQARGFDLSAAMVDRAATMAAELSAGMPAGHVSLVIEQGDACAPLPEATGSVDLCLCLYGVLNHLPPNLLAGVSAELARVTRGRLFVTARAAGSLPTIYVDSVENAVDFRQDNRLDRLDVDLADGRHLSFRSHLFRASDLMDLFAPHCEAASIQGLDLFHSRFRTDPRWNPETVSNDAGFMSQLERLEAFYATDPVFIDRAAHIMLTATNTQH